LQLSLAVIPLRATLVTGDPLEPRPGAGVENELSVQLGAVLVFQCRSRQLACFSASVTAMSDLSDYAAMVISHNRLIGSKGGSPSCTALSVQLSARFSDAQKQLEIIRYSIRQLMQEDRTNRRARMRPAIWSQRRLSKGQECRPFEGDVV
jgi:hypothetical protein